MINIMVADPYVNLVETQKLELAALATLEFDAEELVPDLSIVIEDDARLQALNNDFLQIDAPTDVLSFPSGEEHPDPETGRVYLGDIVISYPRAEEQANTAGHPVFAELQLLVIHGTLHLLGHDHAEPGEKAIMWAAQADLLQALGVPLARLPE
jgi:probable rRNA maturation factor